MEARLNYRNAVASKLYFKNESTYADLNAIENGMIYHIQSRGTSVFSFKRELACVISNPASRRRIWYNLSNCKNSHSNRTKIKSTYVSVQMVFKTSFP